MELVFDTLPQTIRTYELDSRLGDVQRVINEVQAQPRRVSARVPVEEPSDVSRAQIRQIRSAVRRGRVTQESADRQIQQLLERGYTVTRERTRTVSNPARAEAYDRALGEVRAIRTELQGLIDQPIPLVSQSNEIADALTMALRRIPTRRVDAGFRQVFHGTGDLSIDPSNIGVSRFEGGEVGVGPR